MNELIAGWIVSRLKEPSTWAGTGIISLVIHRLFPGILGDDLVNAFQGICGAVAIILSEKGLVKPVK